MNHSTDDEKWRGLHWDDFITPFVEPDDYLHNLVVARDRMMHRSYYRAYHPDPTNLETIQTLLETLPPSESFTILVLGATWCKTCAHVKAILTHIMDKIASPKLRVRFLDGAKLKFGSRAPNPEWASKSPPEFHSPRFNVRTIPTTYVFGPGGTCIGKIEKYPPDGRTFEAYLVDLLKPLFP